MEAAVSGAVGYGFASASQEVMDVSEEIKITAGIFGAANSLIDNRYGAQNRMFSIFLVFLNTLTLITAYNTLVSFKQHSTVIACSITALSVSAFFIRDLSKWTERVCLSSVSCMVSLAQYSLISQIQKISISCLSLVGGTIAGFCYAVCSNAIQPNQDCMVRIKEGSVQFIKFFVPTSLGGWISEGIAAALRHDGYSVSYR